MNFTKLTKEEQLTILANVAEDKGIVDNAVEKDYWVSMVLRAIFSLPYAAAFVFKGGTSLSVPYFLCRMQQLLFSREEQALAKVGD